MHIHITRNSDILALCKEGGKEKWRRISVEQLEEGLLSMKGMNDVVVYCSADDPDKFAIDPPQNSKIIVKMILSFNLPVKFLRYPLVPLEGETAKKNSIEEIPIEQSLFEMAVLKISVLKNGLILVDGKPTAMEELDKLLAIHAAKNGSVWYYREAGQEEPLPHAIEAFQLIIKHRLPISMSSKPDFSDSIDMNGNSQPRKK
jgi:hypothetical protein